MKAVVAHQRELEVQLKRATVSLPPHARSIGVSLAQALGEDVIARAVETSLAVIKDPSSSEARLAALSAVANVRSVTSAMVDTFSDVYLIF